MRPLFTLNNLEACADTKYYAARRTNTYETIVREPCKPRYFVGLAQQTKTVILLVQEIIYSAENFESFVKLVPTSDIDSFVIVKSAQLIGFIATNKYTRVVLQVTANAKRLVK